MESFDDVATGISDATLRGVYGYGFEEPSEVQKKAIPAILSGRDVLVQARSGMGKTAAFGIAICEQVVRAKRSQPMLNLHPFAIVLCHTRELALQSRNVLQQICAYAGVSVVCVIGGTPVQRDAETISRGADIIVGTPGRLQALVDKGVTRLDNLQTFVIDEVDEILKNHTANAFLPIVQALLRRVQNAEMRMVLVSATMPALLRDTISSLVENPVEILIPAKELPLQGIKQYKIRCSSSEKLEKLSQVIGNAPGIQAMVFCATRRGVDDVAAHLLAGGVAVGSLHGEMETKTRNGQMDTFRRGGFTVLVSTDVLARGIDVQQVGLVVLVEMATSVETYLHCVGRCGRFGRKGRAVVLAASYEDADIRSVEQFYNIQLADYDL